ncbi:MAG TPA: hypothetical protein VHZ78_05060, partial [Rhizomicrobium sp.]|nr:hypothetical protein [Rhizomicrobium sp.]
MNTLSGEREDFAAMAQLPDVPPIVSLHEKPPPESARRVVGTTATRLKIFANSDNTSKTAWVDDTPVPLAAPHGLRVGDGTPATLVNYWDGGPAAPYTLTMRQYWQLVDGSYTQIPEGGSLSITISQTTGISTTDTESISAELGITGGGLSATMSATFSHSVTTSQENTLSKTMSVGPPPPGMIRVWVCWQLVDELVALDAGGNVIPSNEGPDGTSSRKADICWFGGLGWVSGAYVYYPNVQQLFPSETFIYSEADF